MKINLSEDGKQLVRSLLESGQFASEDEVIDVALRLLQGREDEAKLPELRREIALGIEQADRGELAPFDPQATLARVRARRAADTGQP